MNGQLSFEEVVTAERSVHEIRLASERALADGRLAYGNELAELADQLFSLVVELRQRDALEIGGRRRTDGAYCRTCGALRMTIGHFAWCPDA